MAHEMNTASQERPQSVPDDEYFQALMQQLYFTPKAAVRTVIVEKEFEFTEEEQSQASSESQTAEAAEGNGTTEEPGTKEKMYNSEDSGNPNDSTSPSDPDTTPAPKKTFLEKAMEWLYNLTNEPN